MIARCNHAQVVKLTARVCARHDTEINIVRSIFHTNSRKLCEPDATEREARRAAAAARLLQSGRRRRTKPSRVRRNRQARRRERDYSRRSIQLIFQLFVGDFTLRKLAKDCGNNQRTAASTRLSLFIVRELVRDEECEGAAAHGRYDGGVLPVLARVVVSIKIQIT